MDYEQTGEALLRLHAGIDSAESHGVLCGLLAVADENAQSQWLAHCAPEVEQGDLLAQEALEVLRALYAHTAAQMKSPDFGFQLLLPDEEAGLAERCEALAHWCQGFLMGISQGGIADPSKLPGELPDFVNDLLKFTQLENLEVGEEGDEASLMELVEYVRMGVQLFFEEIRALKADSDASTLH